VTFISYVVFRRSLSEGARPDSRSVNGRLVLEDGRILDVANVVWCTGFHPGFSWIDLPVLGDDGRPMQERGVAIKEPGLYFVGLMFLYAASSVMIHGVGRDAEYIASAIAARTRASRAA
jgi:putative flavoprotein involved in K+ transport